jgi:hypothetical protein
MVDQPGSARFQPLFESALQAYERTTSFTLAQHPFAAQLERSHSVEDVTILLQARAQPFGGCRASHKLMKSIRATVSTLTHLSGTATLADAIGPVRQSTLMRCIASLTTNFRHYYHPRRQYKLVSVSYLMCVPFFSLYVYTVVSSN